MGVASAVPQHPSSAALLQRPDRIYVRTADALRRTRAPHGPAQWRHLPPSPTGPAAAVQRALRSGSASAVPQPVTRAGAYRDSCCFCRGGVRSAMCSRRPIAYDIARNRHSSSSIGRSSLITK
jgi:hypothetical protein